MRQRLESLEFFDKIFLCRSISSASHNSFASIIFMAQAAVYFFNRTKITVRSILLDDIDHVTDPELPLPNIRSLLKCRLPPSGRWI
jgi:hypothetical protein